MNEKINDEAASDVEALQAEVERLDNELRAAEKRLSDAIIERAPFRVGDVVLVSRQGVEERAIIRAVTSGYGTFPRYAVSFARKDGSWMRRQQRIWRAPRAVESSGVSGE